MLETGHPPMQFLRLAAAPLAPALLAKTGETIAMRLSAVQKHLQQGEVQRVLGELARLERLGLQLQEAARVLNLEGREPLEKVDVARAANQCLQEWRAEAQARGVMVSGPSQAFEIEAVAGVLEQLLDLAVEHALHLGRQVELDCGAEGLPPRPLFRLHIASGGVAPAGSDALDDLHWQLIVTLAHASGGAAHRTVTASGIVIVVELAPPVAAAEARKDDTEGLPRRASLVGRRIALLEPQDAVRWQAVQLLAEAGGIVDAAVSPESVLPQYARHTGLPEILVSGLPVDSPRVEALVQGLTEKQPQLRVVELVDDDAAFEMSAPGTDHPARVGRANLARTLVIAVAQELRP